MADAMLYYRTPTTYKGISTDTYYDPINLPIGQRMEFTFSDNLLEGIDFQYQNNVIDIPVPVSDGTRKINKQDNGLKSILLTINGQFKIPKSGGVPT